jgi:hypothetical protein
MLTFFVFIDHVYETDTRFGPSTTFVTFVFGTYIFLGSSSSYSSSVTLYHSNSFWIVILALCALPKGTSSIDSTFENIFFRMTCSVECMEGASCSNLNVILNIWTNPFHSIVSLSISNSKY